jgi:aquaporin Z
MPSTTKPFRHAAEAKYLSEFIGTFFLVFTIGCNVHVGSLGAVLSIGGILAVMVYSLGSVSGAHLNPAVTVAVGLIGTAKITFQDFCCYIVSQLFGGVVGAVTYLSIFNDAFVLHPTSDYNYYQAMASEVLYTMALCYVVLNVAATEHPKQGNVPNDFFGVAIGLTVTASAIAIGPVTGCSLNPAVSFGSFAAAKAASHSVPVRLFALYFCSPLIGAALAALFFYFVQGGLTNQFEYEGKLIKKNYLADPLNMLPGDEYILSEALTRGKIFFGFQWETKDESISRFEVDAALVKYDKDGAQKGEPIYFSEPHGKEIRDGSKRVSVCEHVSLSQDALTGGIVDATEDYGKNLQRRKFAPRDKQRICISSLADLQKVQQKAEYLFFTVSYFSGEHALQNVSIRLVDAGNDRAACRFEKKHIVHNNILMGVLYHSDNQWIFRVIDEGINSKDEMSGTYRQLAENMEKWVKRLQDTESH